jgi:hypothetical protein
VKIGLSYSRCVRDIVDGVVDMNDVLVLITRTDFDPRDDKQWTSIWEGYHSRSGWSMPEWANYPEEDELKFRNISIDLYDSGKIHQPRQFGAHPTRLPYIWLETVLPSEELDKNPMLKGAWEKFQVLSGLTGTELNKDHAAS